MQSFFLLGLLANYNKFEFQNPYRLRLDDFVNEAAIKKVVLCIGATCASARDRYVAVQDDLPENWTIGNTLSYIGLGVLAPGSRPATPTPTAEQAKNLFVALYVFSCHNVQLMLIVAGQGLKQASSYPLTISPMPTRSFASTLSHWQPNPRTPHLRSARSSP